MPRNDTCPWFICIQISLEANSTAPVKHWLNLKKKKELQVNWQDIVSDVGRIGIRWKAGNSGIC